MNCAQVEQLVTATERV